MSPVKHQDEVKVGLFNLLHLLLIHIAQTGSRFHWELVAHCLL